MTLDELVGKYARLRAELAAAYGAMSWDMRRITRLDDEIASTAVAITQAQPLDEQTSETQPGFLSLYLKKGQPSTAPPSALASSPKAAWRLAKRVWCVQDLRCQGGSCRVACQGLK